MKKEDARAAGAWCIPVYSIAGGSKPGLTQESYAATIAAVQSSYRDEYADDIASKLQPNLLVFRSSPHEAQLDFQMECAASPVLFKFSLVRNLPLLMTPLAASLARREFSTRSVSLRSGYLTLDRTRKAVPLLKVDPLVLQQLLVGVWVYGIQIDDAWDEEVARRQLADPFLYFACIGYLMSEAIRERVGPEKNTFLVALYPASDPSNNSAVGSLPRFFECSFSEFLSSARPLPMELYSNRRSCLVGMSKFSTDVELTLSAAPTNEWEAARRQAKIPTAPRIDEPQHLDASETQVLASNNERGHSEGIPPDSNDQDEDEELTSGWTITDAAIRKSVAQATSMQSQPLTYTKEQADIPVTRAEADTEKAEEKPAIPPSDDDLHDATCAHAVKESSGLNPPNEAEDISGLRQRDWTGNNSSSYRSCCKTQQLLTIQHQQILENQQRQLHEMQEQITQLRRLLEAARNANKKDAHPTPNDEVYDSDASSSSIGAVADVSNVSSTFSRHGNDRQSSQSSRVSSARRRTDDGPFSDKSSNHTHQESNDGGENEDKDVSLSSLGLSSISSGSMDADLSSLSSSIVSERPKLFTSSQSHDANQSEIGAKVEDVGQSRLSEASGDAGQQHVNAEANDDIEVDLSDKSAKQGLVESTEGADAHNLSIGDLSTNLSEEATAVADKASVTFASNENGDSCDAEGVSGDDRAVVERLLPPDAYLRKVGGFVDHHGGCFTTPPLDFHSFCVPRIKFSSEGPECSLSDSDDEEIRLIEQKYKRLMAA
ncbi:unnamed protein product [Phytophthora lilii]|uniref:Unnamed protein product n=1 Tax=Phytophthora lilii TaxID=2077276 RepID=A0A9W6TLS8_9STRA|nr:unnamed protein product [Phytophthora lilii]